MQPAPRQELKQLVEIYSMRTRQLAEALALLGGQVSAERPIEETMTKIKKLSRRVEQAGWDLFAFVEPRPVQRWVASAWVLTEKHFRRIDGHADLWALAAILGREIKSTTQPLKEKVA